ncbi:hypothetical protein GQ457_11G022720 [Hibiscus cannabinus]
MTQPELVPVSFGQSGGSSGGASVVQNVFTNKKVNVVLDEFNYLVWKQQVLLAVRSLRLEKLLTGSLTAPPVTVRSADGTMVENEAYEVFVAQDSALASWLLSTISPSLLPQFVGAETAAAIWSIVLRFFASRSTTTVMSLHYKLHSLKKGDMSMRAYISQIKEICNALASSGSPISDLETIATILNGLSIEYQPFVAVITASREPFTLDAAISVLLDAEVQLSSFNPLSEISSTLNVVQASVATLDINKEGNSAATRPYRQSASGRGKSGRMRLQCQLCGKLGHLVDRCWHQFDENFVPIIARSKESSKSEVNSIFVTESDLGVHSCSCHSTGAGLPAGSDGIPAATSPQVNLVAADDHWFMDSGASHHVSPDPGSSQASAAYYGPGKLTVGNGVSLPILRVGDSVLNSSSRTLRLHNVLHVPSITKNLISVSKLARDNNVFLEFHARSCLVRDEDTKAVLMTGDVVDGLYRFDSSASCFSNSNNKPVAEANVAVQSNKCANSATEPQCTKVAVSGTIPVVPGVEKLWNAEHETLSSMTPGLVSQAGPSTTVQPVRVENVEVPLHDGSSSAHRPVFPEGSTAQSFREPIVSTGNLDVSLSNNQVATSGSHVDSVVPHNSNVSQTVLNNGLDGGDVSSVPECDEVAVPDASSIKSGSRISAKRLQDASSVKSGSGISAKRLQDASSVKSQ